MQSLHIVGRAALGVVLGVVLVVVLQMNTDQTTSSLLGDAGSLSDAGPSNVLKEGLCEYVEIELNGETKPLFLTERCEAGSEFTGVDGGFQINRACTCDLNKVAECRQYNDQWKERYKTELDEDPASWCCVGNQIWALKAIKDTDPCDGPALRHKVDGSEVSFSSGDTPQCWESLLEALDSPSDADLADINWYMMHCSIDAAHPSIDIGDAVDLTDVIPGQVACSVCEDSLEWLYTGIPTDSSSSAESSESSSESSESSAAPEELFCCITDTQECEKVDSTDQCASGITGETRSQCLEQCVVSSSEGSVRSEGSVGSEDSISSDSSASSASSASSDSSTEESSSSSESSTSSVESDLLVDIDKKILMGEGTDSEDCDERRDADGDLIPCVYKGNDIRYQVTITNNHPSKTYRIATSEGEELMFRDVFPENLHGTIVPVSIVRGPGTACSIQNGELACDPFEIAPGQEVEIVYDTYIDKGSTSGCPRHWNSDSAAIVENRVELYQSENTAVSTANQLARLLSAYPNYIRHKYAGAANRVMCNVNEQECSKVKPYGSDTYACLEGTCPKPGQVCKVKDDQCGCHLVDFAITKTTDPVKDMFNQGEVFDYVIRFEQFTGSDLESGHGFFNDLYRFTDRLPNEVELIRPSGSPTGSVSDFNIGPFKCKHRLSLRRDVGRSGNDAVECDFPDGKWSSGPSGAKEIRLPVRVLDKEKLVTSGGDSHCGHVMTNTVFLMEDDWSDSFIAYGKHEARVTCKEDKEVTVIKQLLTDTPTPGENIEFKISIDNDGSELENIVLKDKFSAVFPIMNVTLEEVVDSDDGFDPSDCKQDRLAPNIYECDIKKLGKGKTLEIKLTAVLGDSTECKDYTNTVQVFEDSDSASTEALAEDSASFTVTGCSTSSDASSEDSSSSADSSSEDSSSEDSSSEDSSSTSSEDITKATVAVRAPIKSGLGFCCFGTLNVLDSITGYLDIGYGEDEFEDKTGRNPRDFESAYLSCGRTNQQLLPESLCIDKGTGEKGKFFPPGGIPETDPSDEILNGYREACLKECQYLCCLSPKGKEDYTQYVRKLLSHPDGAVSCDLPSMPREACDALEDESWRTFAHGTLLSRDIEVLKNQCGIIQNNGCCNPKMQTYNPHTDPTSCCTGRKDEDGDGDGFNDPVDFYPADYPIVKKQNTCCEKDDPYFVEVPDGLVAQLKAGVGGFGALGDGGAAPKARGAVYNGACCWDDDLEVNPLTGKCCEVGQLFDLAKEKCVRCAGDADWDHNNGKCCGIGEPKYLHIKGDVEKGTCCPEGAQLNMKSARDGNPQCCVDPTPIYDPREGKCVKEIKRDKDKPKPRPPHGPGRGNPGGGFPPGGIPPAFPPAIPPGGGPGGDAPDPDGGRDGGRGGAVGEPAPPEPFCGDGSVQDENAEECDNGSICTNNGSSCIADEDCTDDASASSGLCIYNFFADLTCPFCRQLTCGDGVIDILEECDDGNNNIGDGCNAICQIEDCGDGVVQQELNEGCDNGSVCAGNASISCITDFECSFCLPTEAGDRCGGDPLGLACENHLDCFVSEDCRDQVDRCISDPENCTIDPECIDPVGQCVYDQEFDPDCIDCIAPLCGDGSVQSTEDCDDGNNANNDGCSAFCIEEFCGDGVVQEDEQCDPGSVCSFDGLTGCIRDRDCNRCLTVPGTDVKRCGGDGNQALCEEDSECANSGFTCDFFAEGNPECSVPQERDPEIPEGEGDGSLGGASVVGRDLSPLSLDPNLESEPECPPDQKVCADGTTVGRDPIRDCAFFPCTEDLKGCLLPGPPPECGNDVLEEGEECDNGEANSDTEPNRCRTDCTLPACGDFITDDLFEESCDDGNQENGDGCNAFCQVCGDGSTDEGETCDDGNALSEDGCSIACQLEFCGDGITQAGLREACDNGSVCSGNPDLSCLTNDECIRCMDIPGQLVKRCGGDPAGRSCSDDVECIDSGYTCDYDQAADILCPNDCSLPFCGDSDLDEGEECDDGNEIDGDGCSSLCQEEFCGDLIVQTDLGEECDEGPGGTSTCSTECTSILCGDGTREDPEECDDGNSVDGDGCSVSCLNEFCGDLVVQEPLGEGCDSGSFCNVGPARNCRTHADCQVCLAIEGTNLKRCYGDRSGAICETDAECIDTELEICVYDTERDASCTEECEAIICGNGIKQGDEECDHGDLNSDELPDACRTDCTKFTCGDGVLDSTEQCDDGNIVPGDGCSDVCLSELCGDGDIDFGEECDDGNNAAQDGCSPQCIVEICGDGVVQPELADGEQCDNGSVCSHNPNISCTTTAHCNRCQIVSGTNVKRCGGDGTAPLCETDDDCPDSIEPCPPGEDCSDRSDTVFTCNYREDDASGCTVACKLVDGGLCGNNRVEGLEECDDGNNAPEDGCSETCLIERCGDGSIQGGLGESCDPGSFCSQDPTRGCRLDSDCRGCLAVPGSTVTRCGGDPRGILCEDASECTDEAYFCTFNQAADLDCTDECRAVVCGDGIPQGRESCDDGNAAAQDGCSPQCQTEFCGDGVTQPGLDELCDNGSICAHDTTRTCRSDDDCRACGPVEGQELLRCGSDPNGRVCETSADCAGTEFSCIYDRDADPSCGVTCLSEGADSGICGNGDLEGLEECDDGNAADEDGCSSACLREFCGDGLVQVAASHAVNFPSEDCDPGSVCSHDALMACRDDSDCRRCLTVANDSNVIRNVQKRCGGDPLGEACTADSDCTDFASDCAVSTSADPLCKTNCTMIMCGDGIEESPEECDDGNAANGDGCSSRCLNEFCGDNVIQAALGETCDNGSVCSQNATLTCTDDADCKICLPVEGSTKNRCGGDPLSIICTADEDCSVTGFTCEYNEDLDTECGANCQGNPATSGECGNEVIEGIEECDDGNLIPEDGCSDTCLNEFCGDGVVQLDLQEACDNSSVCSQDSSLQCRTDSDCNRCLRTGVGDQLRCGGVIEGRRCTEDEHCTAAGFTCAYDIDSDLTCDNNCNEIICGDGDKDHGEQCDDGNSAGGDGCSPTCIREFCGDGVVQPLSNETCDNGSVCSQNPDLSCLSNDDCRVCLQIPGTNTKRCGGDVHAQICNRDAECAILTDFRCVYNTDINLTCTENCGAVQEGLCGDGFEQNPEECDDGNSASEDGCSAQCLNEFCGDGVIQRGELGESCDNGSICSQTNQTISCRSDSDCRRCSRVPGLSITRCGGDTHAAVCTKDADCTEAAFFCEYHAAANTECGSDCSLVSENCGNGQLDDGETCANCPIDAGCPEGHCCQDAICIEGPCTSSDCNNNDICESGENCSCSDCQFVQDGCDNDHRCSQDDVCEINPCGNGVVDLGETCSTCPEDAGCAVGHCCNVGVCIQGSCDTVVCNSDQICDRGENCGCSDCTGKQDSCDAGLICGTNGSCVPSLCGNGTVDAGETCETCPADAGCGTGECCQQGVCTADSCSPVPCNSNGICELGENCSCTDCDGKQDGCDPGLLCAQGSCQRPAPTSSASSASSASSDSPPLIGVCGNGILEGTEECDDGNAVPQDGCSVGCLNEFCGDRTLQPDLGEMCDNGRVCNKNTSLSCRTVDDCHVCLSVSGTSVKRCGGDLSGRICTTDDNCKAASAELGFECIYDADEDLRCSDQCLGPEGLCGNGTEQSPEECDDGNATSGDGCSSSCLDEFCGDGVIQSGLGETCDNGSVCSQNATLDCRTDRDCRRCQRVLNTATNTSNVQMRCGGDPDAVACTEDSDCVNTSFTCNYNSTANADCNAVCEGPVPPLTCGNGRVDTGETCATCPQDAGCAAGECCSQGICSSSCITVQCDGDGICELGENCGCIDCLSEKDGCGTNLACGESQTCEETICGDGIVQGTEECDDGNARSQDGCSVSCEDEFCGDDIVQANLGETCDNGSVCSQNSSVSCRDDIDCLVCLSVPGTSIKRCGGDVLSIICREDSDCLDLGFTCGYDAQADTDCSNSCANATSGVCANDTLDPGEECDDGNAASEDGCSVSCLNEFCGDGVVQAGLSETCDNGSVCSQNSSLECRTDSDCNTCRRIANTNPNVTNIIMRCGGDPLAPACEVDSDCTTTFTCGYNTAANTECKDDCTGVSTIAGICGNGTVESGEECDDGNSLDGDGCTKACVSEFCGDSVIQAGLGEMCDNGRVCSHDTAISCRQNSDCRTCRSIPGTSVSRCGGDPSAALCTTNSDCTDATFTCEYDLAADTACDGQCKGESTVTGICGDRTVNTGEECDDGNNTSGDGCSLDCKREFCGDGVVQEGTRNEDCDNGSVCSNNANKSCTANADCRTCETVAGTTVKRCGGDGSATICTVDSDCAGATTLVCGYNTAADASCTRACRSTTAGSGNCGDGTVQSGEECDDGDQNSNTRPNACRSDCQRADCGDGIIDSSEECDDGNTRSGDGCSSSCRRDGGGGGGGLTTGTTGTIRGIAGTTGAIRGVGSTIGSALRGTTGGATIGSALQGAIGGTIGSALQGAIGGNVGGNVGGTTGGTGGGGSTTIASSGPICGDGLSEPPEECDDGNTQDFDGCSGACLLEAGFCGDGVVQFALGEQCEPSLHDPALPYGCNQLCQHAFSFCGNGEIDPGEECDNGPDNSDLPDSSCRTNCAQARCGDGIVDSWEQCDDYNLVGGDGCDRVCRIETGAPGEFVPLPVQPGQPPIIAGDLGTGLPPAVSDGGSGYQPPVASVTTPPTPAGQIAGDTGPAAAAVMAAGAAMGWGWMRRRRRQESGTRSQEPGEV